jgi:hypothetical protein
MRIGSLVTIKGPIGNRDDLRIGLVIGIIVPRNIVQVLWNSNNENSIFRTYNGIILNEKECDLEVIS